MHTYRIKTEADILATAYCEVHSASKALARGRACTCGGEECDGYEGHPTLGTLGDLRMGPRLRTERCLTCRGRAHECPGHAGYLRLERPVFLMHWQEQVTRLLKKLCARCMRMPQGHARCPRGKCRACAREEFALTGACPHGVPCTSTSAEVRWDAKEGWYDIETGGRRERWGAADVLRCFAAFLPETYAGLGVHEDIVGMVPSVLEVEATSARAYFKADGSWHAHARTGLYADVLEANARLRERLARKDAAVVVETAVNALQQAVSKLFDAAHTRHAGAAPGEPAALVTSLNGKNGYMRGNLLGKRSDFTGRSVVTCDPDIGLNEIAVPPSVARTLACPELVTDMNLAAMQRLVQSGEGWLSALVCGQRFFMKDASERRLGELARRLRAGDIVQRHLRDGDVLVFNRQPTLHRMGFMAHHVRIVQQDTFGLHPNATEPYNADFDGDEMNVHAPQSLPALVECRTLMDFKEHLISPNGSPSFSMIQNTTLGANLLSRRETFLTYDTFQQLCMALCAPGRPCGRECWMRGARPCAHSVDQPCATECTPRMPWPAAFSRAGRRWTGMQALSQCLPRATTQLGSTFSEGRDELVVLSGELLAGELDKGSLASVRGNFLHSVLLAESSDDGLRVVEALGRMAMAFLEMRGFSVSLGDCNVRVEQPELALPRDTTEHDVMAALQAARTENQARTNAYLSTRENSFYDMIRSGSKGNYGNAAQVMCGVGNQDYKGGRLPLFLKTRSLPVFLPNDDSPAARGFVRSSYMQGLRPAELFCHLMASRVGLVQTAMGPAVSGYMSRQMSESLKNLHVDYTGAVVGEWGQIVQFAYGEDGLDWRRMRYAAVDFPLPVGDFAYLDRARYEMPWDLEAEARFLKKDAHGDVAEAERVTRKLRAIKTSPRLSAVLEHRFPGALYRDSPALDSLIQELEKGVERGSVEAGEPVGILAAQAIGEQATQKTLDTFHSTGNKAQDQATQVTPRVQEIVFMMPEINVPRVDVECADPLALCGRVTAQPFFLSIEPATPAHYERPWARRWLKSGLPRVEARVFAVLRREAFLEWKPDAMHSHDVYDESLELLSELDEAALRQQYRSADEIAEAAWVTGGTASLIVRGKDALHRVAWHAEGAFTVRSTDILDVMQTFGIEAARACALRELTAMQMCDPATANVRHFLLLLDAMAWSGRMVGARWNGTGSVMRSPLGAACFERPMKRFVSAALAHARENPNHVSTALITGRPIPVGTGLRAFGTLHDVEGERESICALGAAANVIDDEGAYAIPETEFVPAKRVRFYDPEEEYYVTS